MIYIIEIILLTVVVISTLAMLLALFNMLTGAVADRKVIYGLKAIFWFMILSIGVILSAVFHAATKEPPPVVCVECGVLVGKDGEK